MIEGIKKVKMLKTLKSTDDNGKPIYFKAGDVYDPKVKPIPQPVLREIKLNRPGVLEVEYEPKPPSETVKVEIPDEVIKEIEAVEKAQEVTPDDSPEKKAITKKPTSRRRTTSKTKK